MHGQWWPKFSRSFKGFEIYVLNLQCRLIFLHFYPPLAYQCYHISASTSKIQAPVVWHHTWVLENALRSQVNIFLIYPQKWWSIGSRPLCARVALFSHFSRLFPPQARFLHPPPSPPETRESETLLPCRVSLDSPKARCTVGALLSVGKLKAGHFLKSRH